MTAYLVAAAGGAIGAMARYAVGLAVRKRGKAAHHGTLVINLLGAFLIGMMAALQEAHDLAYLYIFIVSGILGGFTTFSTFAVQLSGMLSGGNWKTAAQYGGATLLLGIPCAAAGYYILQPLL